MPPALDDAPARRVSLRQTRAAHGALPIQLSCLQRVYRSPVPTIIPRTALVIVAPVRRNDSSPSRRVGATSRPRALDAVPPRRLFSDSRTSPHNPAEIDRWSPAQAAKAACHPLSVLLQRSILRPWRRAAAAHRFDTPWPALGCPSACCSTSRPFSLDLVVHEHDLSVILDSTRLGHPARPPRGEPIGHYVATAVREGYVLSSQHFACAHARSWRRRSAIPAELRALSAYVPHDRSIFSPVSRPLGPRVRVSPRCVSSAVRPSPRAADAAFARAAPRSCARCAGPIPALPSARREKVIAVRSGTALSAALRLDEMTAAQLHRARATPRFFECRSSSALANSLRRCARVSCRL